MLLIGLGSLAVMAAGTLCAVDEVTETAATATRDYLHLELEQRRAHALYRQAHASLNNISTLLLRLDWAAYRALEEIALVLKAPTPQELLVNSRLRLLVEDDFSVDRESDDVVIGLAMSYLSLALPHTWLTGRYASLANKETASLCRVRTAELQRSRAELAELIVTLDELTVLVTEEQSDLEELLTRSRPLIGRMRCLGSWDPRRLVIAWHLRSISERTQRLREVGTKPLLESVERSFQTLSLHSPTHA